MVAIFGIGIPNIATILSVPFCLYHFVHTILSHTILSIYHFVHTILSVPFCPLPFCPVTVYIYMYIFMYNCIYVPVLSRILERIVMSRYIYPAFDHLPFRLRIQDQFAFRPTSLL